MIDERSGMVAGVNVYVRVAHSKTQRDGWGYESTVSLTWDGDPDDPEMMAKMARLMEEADTVARIERNRRRDMDRQEQEYGPQ